MDNHVDIENISKQLKALKSNIYQSKEHLYAIEMLLVDSNNSHLKDQNLSDDFQQLTNSFTSLMNSIKSVENKLKHPSR